VVIAETITEAVYEGIQGETELSGGGT